MTRSTRPATGRLSRRALFDRGDAPPRWWLSARRDPAPPPPEVEAPGETPR